MTCPAIRFSGEMNTSLGNSIVNLVSIHVVARKLGFIPKCIVEGDDALIAVPDHITKEDFQMQMHTLGFNIKIDEYPHPGQAGFCGLWWTRGEHVVNVMPMLPDLFWTQPSALKDCTEEDLLYAKLNSFAAADPSMPGLWPYFKTRNVTCHLNQYEAESMGASPGARTFTMVTTKGIEPTWEHRLAYYEKTGFTLTDQIYAENLGSLSLAVDHMLAFSQQRAMTASEYTDGVNRV